MRGERAQGGGMLSPAITSSGEPLNAYEGAYPINAYPDGTARTIKAQYKFTSRVNLERTGSYGATGVGYGNRKRKLTPRECFRLQGVSEEDIDTIQAAGISRTRQYTLAGNSITVDVLYHIFRKMFVDTDAKREPIQLNLFNE